MIGIEEETGLQRVDGTPVPDTALDSTSTNSVQNKVVTENINQMNTNLAAFMLDNNSTQTLKKEFSASGTYKITDDGLYQLILGSGSDANEAATISFSINGWTVLSLVLLQQYTSSVSFVYLKKDTVVTYSHRGSTRRGRIYLIS